MGLSSWIWTFGSALPSGKMAKFSLGKVTARDQANILTNVLAIIPTRESRQSVRDPDLVAA